MGGICSKLRDIWMNILNFQHLPNLSFIIYMLHEMKWYSYHIWGVELCESLYLRVSYQCITPFRMVKPQLMNLHPCWVKRLLKRPTQSDIIVFDNSEESRDNALLCCTMNFNNSVSSLNPIKHHIFKSMQKPEKCRRTPSHGLMGDPVNLVNRPIKFWSR